MSLSIIYTRAQLGIDAPRVTVETHLSNGLPALSIVGLPETSVKESKERVRSALINSGFEFPARRITINLAPADLPKQGGRYDLAIAMGILAATGQIETKALDRYEFLGELALTGEIRSVTGVLPGAIACSEDKHNMFIPHENIAEASLADCNQIYGASHLLEICKHINQIDLIKPNSSLIEEQQAPRFKDMIDVKGQLQAKRALEVAAAGRHNLLFFGPPGTGKSMLASRLPGILPRLSKTEAVSVASIHSLTGQARSLSELRIAPFRAPHHTASAVSLVGGGSTPKPGEISLAHHGVLFLDELPEYARSVLEVLREPIESKEIRISRANSTLTFPANFQLISAMNPCPCGYSGHPSISCSDTPQQISNYRRKLSGPLLDRFDLHVEVSSQPSSVIFNDKMEGEPSSTILERVEHARNLQYQRQSKLNSELEGRDVIELCYLDNSTQSFLENAMNKLSLSARATHRVLKVSRTLADLDNAKHITLKHITEALSYRNLDRKQSLV